MRVSARAPTRRLVFVEHFPAQRRVAPFVQDRDLGPILERDRVVRDLAHLPLALGGVAGDGAEPGTDDELPWAHVAVPVAVPGT